MSATAEKRQLASAMFWPDVTEEIALIADDAKRYLIWNGAIFSCLESNSFPASVVEEAAGSDEYRCTAVRAFLDFIRDHFEPVADDELDAG